MPVDIENNVNNQNIYTLYHFFFFFFNGALTVGLNVKQKFINFEINMDLYKNDCLSDGGSQFKTFLGSKTFSHK